MLIKKAFVIVHPQCDATAFIDTLSQHFNDLQIISSWDQVLNSIQRSNETGDILYLFFVESRLLDVAQNPLSSDLIHLNPIMVAFSSDGSFTPPLDMHIFEFVNIHSFNEAFFFHKLSTEISNREQIALLKYQVKEFYHIGKSLNSEKDKVKLLEMIINSSLKMTSSDAATLYLVIDKEHGLWTSIKNQPPNQMLLKFVIAKNTSIAIDLQESTSPITRESISGYTVITGNPVRIDDAYQLTQDVDYRHDRSFDSSTGYRTKSILAVPMKDHEDHVMGVIQLLNKKLVPDEKIDYTHPQAIEKIIPFTATDELIMNSLAGQAAVALENNLLYKDMQNLLESYKAQNRQLDFLSRKILQAHEEERKRIAREIHDGPAQSVVNLSFKVELCNKYLQSGAYEKVVDTIQDLNTNIRATAREIRTIIYDLKPSYLEDGLMKALENHFSVFEQNTGLKVTFVVRGNDASIEYYMASTLYRITQEALSNIFKHAHAKNVTVDFTVSESEIVLAITDDGKGFDTSELSVKKPHKLEGGFGLEGIRERVEIIKGELVIRSSLGKGTSLLLRIPLSYPG